MYLYKPYHLQSLLFCKQKEEISISTFLLVKVFSLHKQANVK